MVGGQHQQGQSSLSHIPTQSWYPPSVVSPSNTGTIPNSNVGTSLQPGLHSRGSGGKPSSDSRLQSSTIDPSPPIASSSTVAFMGTFPPLRDKSVDELKRLLSDKGAYNKFLHSLDNVGNLNSLRDDLKKSNFELAKQNLEKESQIAELRNQCTIIRTSELAAAQEKIEEVQKRQRIVGQLTIPVILQRLEEAAKQADGESENLHCQLVAGELDLIEFIPKYRKLRTMYHRQTLICLAARSSCPPG
eukprot:c2820_g1_i1 orf=473-1210(-)